MELTDDELNIAVARAMGMKTGAELGAGYPHYWFSPIPGECPVSGDIYKPSTNFEQAKGFFKYVNLRVEPSLLERVISESDRAPFFKLICAIMLTPRDICEIGLEALRRSDHKPETFPWQEPA